MSKLTKEFIAMLLSGILVIGSATNCVLAASIDLGPSQTSEIAEEVYDKDTSEAPVGAGESYPEEAPAEEEAAVRYYTVTLDANGGYFENEWDDSIGEIVEQVEVVEKHVPLDRTVSAFPVFTDQDDQSMVFAGWSLERDGEVVTTGDEEYAPVENCALYAVWHAVESDDASWESTDNQEYTDESTEQEDLVQEATEETESVEGTEAGNDVTEMIEEIETSEESDTVRGAKESDDVEPKKVTQEHEVTEDIDTAQEFEDSEIAETVQETTEDTENAEEESKNIEVEEASRDIEAAKETEIAQGENDVKETVADMNTGLDSDDDKNEIFEGRTYDKGEEQIVNPDQELDVDDKVVTENKMLLSNNMGNSSEIIRLALNSYKEYLEGKGFAVFTSPTGFFLQDITGDSIPELILRYGSIVDGSIEIISYENHNQNMLLISGLSNKIYCNNEKRYTVVYIVNPRYQVSEKYEIISYEGEERGYYDISQGRYEYYNPDTAALYDIGEEKYDIEINKLLSGTYIISANDAIYDNSEEIRNTVFKQANIELLGIISSGTCGDNLTWILDEAGTLTISGTGKMTSAPWQHDYWNDIKSIIIEKGASNICESAFCGCHNLTQVMIPESVYNIQANAFAECEKLNNLSIPEGVTIIGIGAFYGCRNLTSVTIPNSVIDVQDGAFQFCSSLQTVTLPESITEILPGLFGACSSLKEIKIPNSVINIRYDAFQGCESLTNITIPANVKSIEAQAFDGCRGLKKVSFTGNAPTIASDAFSGVVATAYYLPNDPTWIEDVRQNYGGTITWVPWNPGTDPITCPFRMTAPGFVTPRDVFSFTNSVKDIGINAGAPYPVNYEWYHFFEERHFTVSEVKSILRKCTSFGGVCAGMTSIIMQNYLGLFYPVSVQSDAKSLNDINSPSTNSKIQTLIGINQYCLINDSYNIKQHNFQKENNGKDTLRLLCSLARNIEETSKPIYVDFCFLEDYSSWQKDNSKGCGAHAMLVYGIESSESYYEINDKKYKYRLLTINPNYQYVGNDSGEDYCIYISETYDSCVIPKSGTMQDNVNNGVLSYCGKEENFKKTNDFYFQYITNDINDILPTGTEIASELNPYFIFTGSLLESVTINKKPLAESDRVIGIVHSPFGSFSDSPTYILDKGECTIKLPQKDEITISGEDTFIIFNEDNGGELKIDNNNMISVSSEGAFSVSITSENLLLDNDDLVTFSIEGEKASNIQIDLSENNGVKLNGTIDSGTVLKYSSIDYGEEYTYNVADSISNIFVSVDEDIVIGDVDISSGSCGENVIWKLNSDGTLTISGSGPMEDFAYSSAAPWYGKTINSVVIGDGITRIGDYAFFDSAMTNLSLPDSLESIGCFSFSGLTGLNTINIPRGVTSIDQGAFAGSSYKTNKIMSITVDENNTNYSENDGVVYSKDGRILVAYPPGRLGEFSVPEGVQVIGDSAFSGCKGVTGILIPDGVTVIENLAFAATGMSDATIPNSVQSIGESAFANCRELKLVFIEGSVKTLKQSTFNICYNLQTIYLPESIEKIEQNTFFDCHSLKDVYFSGSERTWSKVVIEQGKVYDTYILDATVHFAKENETIVLNESCVSIKIDDQIWTGKPLIPVVDVKYENESIIEGTDYEVSYANNTNVGTATVTITGAGYYTGTVSRTFKINAASITNATVIGVSNKTYTGSALTQNPTVTVGDKTLTKGTDYTVSYANNTNAGTATVTITGKNNYTGTKTATFKINKASQGIIAKSSSASVAIGKTAVISITGAKGTKSYKSSNTSIATVDSKTGKVTAKKVGTVKITAISAATSNYNAASKTVTIKVIPAATSSITSANQATGIKLTWKKVTGATGYKVYRGSTLIKTIETGSTVTCTDTKANTNGTKYSFKIIPTASSGNGIAKSLITYRVARPAISSVINSASNKVTVKWGKNAKANGYQIQYSTSKTFATGNKTASVTSAATISKVIGSLSKGKTYYVRIRTYKTVGKTKYWSTWSTLKSVKISK